MFKKSKRKKALNSIFQSLKIVFLQAGYHQNASPLPESWVEEEYFVGYIMGLAMGCSFMSSHPNDYEEIGYYFDEILKNYFPQIDAIDVLAYHEESRMNNSSIFNQALITAGEEMKQMLVECEELEKKGLKLIMLDSSHKFLPSLHKYLETIK